MAEIISLKGVNIPCLLDRICSSSVAEGGISGVLETDQRTEVIEQNEPTKKDPKTQKGIPACVSPLITC